MILCILALALAAIPTAMANDLVDPSPERVCVQPNKDCYYLPYTSPSGSFCPTGYDDNGAGDPVGYGCSRSPIGACLFEYPDGDGTTCVVLLKPGPGGLTCLVSYASWEGGSGYQQYICFS